MMGVGGLDKFFGDDDVWMQSEANKKVVNVGRSFLMVLGNEAVNTSFGQVFSIDTSIDEVQKQN